MILDFFRKQSKGFTLIEILIVIVIISIVSGVALVTLSNNKTKQLESLAKQFTRLVTLAEQEAMLRPSTLGLALGDHYFQFLQYSPSDNNAYPWQTLTSKNLGLHDIPGHVQIMLTINHERITLDGKPHIFISESGDITPFTMTFAKKGEKPAYVVRGDASGKVQTEIYHEK